MTEEYTRFVGADGFAREASTATRIAIDFIKKGDNSKYLITPEVDSTGRGYTKISGVIDLTKPKRNLPAKPHMKPVERVQAVLRHEEPDRVPHFEWSQDIGLIRALANGGDYFDLIEALDIDGVVTKAAYRKKDLGDGIFVDEWGAMRRMGKDDYAMPMDDNAPLKSLADLEKWEVPDPDDPYRYEPIKAVVERFGGERAIIMQIRDVWSGPRDYLGYAQLFINLKECPELVEGIVTRVVDHYIRVAERAADMGVTFFFTGDDVADNRGAMFSPTLWEEIFLPHYRRLIKAIHGVGLYHWKHSDGNMYPLLDSIVEAGSDGIDPIDPSGGMELCVVKAKYGDQIAIKGNVDQTELLMYGPPEKVVEAVKSCIRDAGQRGGYVCSSSNSIHSGVDPQLYKLMVETIHHYGRYPLDMELLAPNLDLVTTTA